MKKRVTRRNFLQLSAMTTVGAVLAACANTPEATVQPTEPSGVVEQPTVAPEAEATVAPQPTTGAVSAPKEAPMLTELVNAGQLPPVADRLPKQPKVVEVAEEIGQYGGTIRIVTAVPSDLSDTDTFDYEGLLTWKTDLTGVIPNIAESWEQTEDGKTLTLHLREGMKWSDGEPFTADDIMFWWEDVIGDDELTPAKPVKWAPGGEQMKVQKLDDFTVQLDFAVPYPFVSNMLAHSDGQPTNFFFPKHYMQQFHPNYVSRDDLTQQAKDAGFDDWFQLFNARSRDDGGIPLDNPDLPVVNMWGLKEQTAAYWQLERNPYYFKVDPDGNQLPYVDAGFISLVEDVQMVTAKISTGETDFAAKNNMITDYPLFQANADASNYRVLLWKHIYGSAMIFQFNLTYEHDEALRDIFRDLRFRQAMSLAINRDEINHVVFYDRGTARQWTVLPTSKYFKPEYEQSYAAFDPDTANSLLDEMGLDKRDSEGYRLRPDGQRLAFTCEYYPIEAPKEPIAELVAEYWDNVGVQCSMKQISGELSQMRYPANEVAVGAWHGDKSTDVLFPLTPQFFVPYNTGWETTWAPLWAKWYNSGGTDGEEPPDNAKQLLDWWDEVLQTADEDKRMELCQNILQSQADNLWVIGTVGMIPVPVVVSNNLRNVPEEILYGWDTLFGSYHNPSTFFFKQS